MTFVLALTILASSLTSSAQYTQAIKGDTVEFDSAVVVRLDKYRIIRSAVGDAPAVIDSLQTLVYEAENIAAMTELIDKSYRSDIEILEEKIKIYEMENEAQDSLFRSSNEIALTTTEKPKKRLWQKIREGLLWLAAGVVIGSL